MLLGVAYNIDRVTGKCRASRISDLGFDAESQDAAFIRMETSEQFFDFTNKRYTYTGQVGDAFCVCAISTLCVCVCVCVLLRARARACVRVSSSMCVCVYI